MLRDLEPLSTSTGAYAFVVLLGLLWGSFANVCIYRWPPSAEFPNGRSVVKPGSHCFACGTPIVWYDNVPLLAWLWLRGQCRTCKAPFSPRYLIVEAVTGVLFGLAWWMTMSVGVLWEPFDARLARFAIYATFCFVMVVITFIDIDTKLILNKITIPSALAFYGASLLLPERHWYDGVIGAVVGYGLPWSIGEVYWQLTKREGLGLGDSTMLAAVGALLGVEGVVASLAIGALVGSVVGVLVLFRAQHAEGSTVTPRSRWARVFPVIAVASVVVATVGMLAGWLVVGAAGSVLALGSLVLARRVEPDERQAAEDGSQVPDSAPPDPVPGKELLVRVVALIAGASVLFAVVLAMLGTMIGAAASGALGIGLLLVARRIVVVDAGEAEASGPEPVAAALEPEPPASLMRTELPFGPFLAVGALLFLFAEPWIDLYFHLPGR